MRRWTPPWCAPWSRSCGDERRGNRDGERGGERHARPAAGTTDMRKGFTGLSALVQNAVASSPLCGHFFVFRGRRGDLIKLLWWDGTGLCLMAKRLERGRSIWPQAQSGGVSLSAAQLSMLLAGIEVDYHGCADGDIYPAQGDSIHAEYAGEHPP